MTTKKISQKQNISSKKSRPPVVTVLGHVDHGKTTLLDKIRQTNVAATEKGGITQHISFYQIKKDGKIITFLDTPGHEAFTTIRERGVILTDIALLVVAADDGVKPQTIEAINYCKKRQVPIIVAINKIDKPEADVSRVKKELSEQGIVVEDWGGKTIAVEISAKTGKGVDDLLEMILLVAEMEEFSADPKTLASGIIIESRLDPKRGPLANILIQKGTLRIGDFLKAGNTFGKVKRIEDFKGMKFRAPHGMTAELLTKLGASVVILPGGEVYSALDKGVIDGTDWGTPSMNKRMGFFQVAKYFNFPGFHSMPVGDFTVNMKEWNKLPDDIKQILKTAVREWCWDMVERVAIDDLSAVKEMTAKGVTPVAWSEEDLARVRQVVQEVWNEWEKKSPMCKKVIEAQKAWLRELGRIK